MQMNFTVKTQPQEILKTGVFLWREKSCLGHTHTLMISVATRYSLES